MKRFYLIGLVLLVTFAACDNLLDDDGNGGGSNSRQKIVATTVADLTDLRDDAHVKLTGTIKEYLWEDRYLFEDSTGTVEVEIDYEVWRRNSLDPNTLPVDVEIVGELDKKRGGRQEIDVDRLTNGDNLLGNGGNGGGGGNGRQRIVPATVADLTDLRDDTHVKLTGTIKEHVWEDRYLFEDSTGTVDVEIDYAIWRRNSLDPNTLPIDVEIVGELDKDRGGWKEIDVDRLTKL